MKRKLDYLLLLLAVLVLYSVGIFILPATYKYSSGRPDGAYFTTMEMINSIAAGNHGYQGPIKGTLVVSAGSLANYRLLVNRDVDVTILQNDMPKNTELRTIAKLGEEFLFIYTRNEDSYRDIMDLNGGSIAVGSNGSGADIILSKILEYLGQTGFTLRKRYYSLDEAVNLLERRVIDAFFIVQSIDAATRHTQFNRDSIKLIPLVETDGEGLPGRGWINGFLHKNSVYRIKSMKQGLLPPDQNNPDGYPRRDINTISVDTILATGTWVKMAIINNLVSSCISMNGDLGVENSITSGVDFNPTFPLHESTRSYMNKGEPGFFERYAEVMGLAVSLTVLSIGAIKSLNYRIKYNEKQVMDEFYFEINIILESMFQKPISEKDLKKCSIDLENIRLKALRLLIDDKIQAGESYTILQGMLSEARDLIASAREKSKFQ